MRESLRLKISFRLLLLTMGLLLTAFPFRLQADVNEHLNPLVTLMIQRLQLSREVAWSKCLAGIPVADPTREARMLTDLKNMGTQTGLSSAEVVRLFLPQIAASRRYQQELIAGWRSGIEVPKIKPLDLASEIRPRLDKLNREMLRQWVVVCHTQFDWADREEAQRMLQQRGIPADVAKIAVSPLIH
jgi:chorismate mutase-like protein